MKKGASLMEDNPVRQSRTILPNGTGATFPYPSDSQWFDEDTKVDPTVCCNYPSIGSGGRHQTALRADGRRWVSIATLMFTLCYPP